tara:strand:+ start:3282 stop:4004 length:723 start_codon:yes stop_codon:yes gene_type:complete
VVNIKKQVFKTKFLSEDLKETQQIYKEAQLDFLQEISKLHEELNVYDDVLDNKDELLKKSSASQEAESKKRSSIDDPEASHSATSNDAEEEVIEKPKLPQWAKKLYYAITIATHPDKLSGLDKEEKEEKVKLYTRAAKASADVDISSIVIIAVELDLKIPENKEVFKILDDKCLLMQKEIADLKDTLYWVWYHSSPGQKNQILSKFIQERGWAQASSMVRKSRKGNRPGKGIAAIRRKLN